MLELLKLRRGYIGTLLNSKSELAEDLLCHEKALSEKLEKKHNELVVGADDVSEEEQIQSQSNADNFEISSERLEKQLDAVRAHINHIPSMTLSELISNYPSIEEIEERIFIQKKGKATDDIAEEDNKKKVYFTQIKLSHDFSFLRYLVISGSIDKSHEAYHGFLSRLALLGRA